MTKRRGTDSIDIFEGFYIRCSKALTTVLILNIG